MGPHRDFSRDVNKSEVPGLGLPGSTLRAVNENDLEERIVVKLMIVLRPGSELLVGRHQGRGDIVCEEMSLSIDVEELNDIAAADNASLAGFRDGFCRDNLPEVVGVVVGITSDLLACGAN